MSAEIFYKTCFYTLFKLSGFQDQNITQVTAACTSLVNRITCNLRCNDIQFDVETIFYNFCKPTGLNALVVSRNIEEFQCHYITAACISCLCSCFSSCFSSCFGSCCAVCIGGSTFCRSRTTATSCEHASHHGCCTQE